MGRPRKARRDLPERVYFEDGVYRYRPKGQPAALLGKDLSEALIAYGRLQAVKVVLATLGDCMDRYLAEVVPTKAPRTQLDNAREMANLRRSFGHFLPNEVTAQDIYRYLDGRGAPVRANREIALL